MYKRNQFFKYAVNFKDDEGEGGSGGGGGEGDNKPTLDDVVAKNTDLQSQLDKVLAKNDQLLTEAKNAKSAKREAEDAARTNSEEALKKAGDFEALYKSSQTALEKATNELSDTKQGIANERRNTAAMKMASEIAEGANVELLSEFIGRRLRYEDGAIKITDISGNLTVSSIDDLKNEFKSDAKYSSLLKGNQSSGGGATGSKDGSGAASKQLGRAEFDALNPVKRMEFVKSGGTITD